MIAITGANGLLGSFIVRKLIESGKPFVAIKRKGSDTSLLRDVDHLITWKEADVTDFDAIQEAIQGCTHVIHAAAIVSFNPRHKRKIFNVNINGTRNVVNACLLNNVTRLIHVSSVAALGRQKDKPELDETNKWADNPMNSTYGESKYLAELEVFRGQEEGLSTVIVNPSLILAPADWDKSSAKLFKYVWSQRPYYTNGFLNYVDVRDVARAVYELLHQSVERERFIISAGNISYEEFFKQIAKRFNKKAPRLKLSRNFLRVAAVFEALRSWLVNSEPLLTQETVRIAGMYFVYNNQKIRKTLNFEFQTIDKTLQWCCDYYITKFSPKN
jgi:dihydroflavonol-4-reductase